MYGVNTVNNFQISMMKRDGMSLAEIAKKTGLDPDEITRRLKSYVASSAAAGVASARRSDKSKCNKHLHPEQYGGRAAT